MEPSRVSAVEQRNFLLSCATWQDGLLQSYRSLHLTIQGFLVASGAAVLAVQLTGAVQEVSARLLANLVFNAMFTLLVIFLHWLQRKTSTELRGAIESRAQDINFWHQQVILSENALNPDQRSFTYFKMWQQARRGSVEHLLPELLPPEGIDEKKAAGLIGKGLGHTRRVLDLNLFHRMQALWNGMLAASLGITLWFVFLLIRT